MITLGKIPDNMVILNRLSTADAVTLWLELVDRPCQRLHPVNTDCKQCRLFDAITTRLTVDSRMATLVEKK